MTDSTTGRQSAVWPTRSFALTAMLALTLAACGSTVQVGRDAIAGRDQAGLDGIGAADGLGGPSSGSTVVGADGLEGPSTGSPVVGGTSGTGASGQPASAASPGLSTTAPPSGPTPSAGGSPPREGGSGPEGSAEDGGGLQGGSAPGLTDTEIYLGVSGVEGYEERTGAAGIAATSGDTGEYIRILTEDLNARGGIAGREVVPVIHNYDANSVQTSEQQQQAACATWTEDNRVFAALIPANARPNLLGCLNDAGVGIIATGPITDLDDTDYARYPALATTNAPSLHNVARLLSDGLFEAGYYQPESPLGTVTIGLLRFDFPSHRRATEEVLKPALARHGLEVAEEIEIQFPASNAEYGGALAQLQNAVLRFNAVGVDHVLLFDRNGIQILFFTRFAENQNYRPQYGLTSLSTPQIAWGIGALSAEQVRTAIGVGWYPGGDSAADFRPQNSNTERCQELMRRNGVEPADEAAEAFVLIYCDWFWLAEAALNAAPAPLTLNSFVAGIESLGDQYLPPGGLRARFGPGQHDGAGEWAPIAFNSDCPCFSYTAEPRPY